MSSTCTDKINPSSRCANKHSQFETFSQPYFNKIFSNCLFHNSPAQGWPYKFRSRGTTGSFILDHELGHLCCCRRTQMSGHPDFGIFSNIGTSSIFTWMWADTVSAACPAQPGSREMISMIFVAVICDAVNTAYVLESSFTMSPRRTTRPLFQNSSGDKCTFTSLLLASSITADLFLTFAKLHAETFSSSPHSLSTASLSLCTKSQWCSELSPFPPKWSSRILGSFLPYAVFGFHLLPIHMLIWVCDHLIQYRSPCSGILPFCKA